MTVWIVMEYSLDDSQVVGVYASQLAAERFVEEEPIRRQLRLYVQAWEVRNT